MNATLTSWAPGALLLGASVTTTVTVAGAAAGMACVATPSGDLGAGAVYVAWISAPNTVSIRVTAVIAQTPATLNWQVRCFP